MKELMNPRKSVFEQIRHIDENGIEYWSAREMAKVLEYSEYRHFLPVIEKAKEACINSNNQPLDHFEDVLEMVGIGSGAKRPLESVKLSRYACYLIVQNADPSKEVVANGQTYFAVQTRCLSSPNVSDHINATNRGQTIYRQPMETNILRLNFPQWQGAESANVAHHVPELTPAQSQTGYYLGSKLIEWLAPTDLPTATVPVSLDTKDVAVENGIFAYRANKKQQQAALDILQEHNPERVVIVGGDCAVSVAPFSYLAHRYPDDVAVIWIDAHPDLGFPGNEYTGYHAMALAQLVGHGDSGIARLLPATFNPGHTLIVGLRYFGEPAEQRRKDLGIGTVSCKQANRSSQKVLEWLKQSGKSKAVVHFDLDVLDPEELKIAVGTDADGLNIASAVRLIQDIAQNTDMVGLTIAEPMPREVIKLKQLLDNLPMFNKKWHKC